MELLFNQFKIRNSFTLDNSAVSLANKRGDQTGKEGLEEEHENENDVSLITDLVGLERFEAGKKRGFVEKSGVGNGTDLGRVYMVIGWDEGLKLGVQKRE